MKTAGIHPGESGYRAWLRYEPITDSSLLEAYRALCGRIVAAPSTQGDERVAAAVDELSRACEGMLGIRPTLDTAAPRGGSDPSRTPAGIELALETADTARDGDYRIESPSGATGIRLSARTGVGLLYAAFHLIRLMQTGSKPTGLAISEAPANELRMLNHWDNADGSVERGYAGRSIFFQDGRLVRDTARLTDYARMLASVGINAIAINNVNAGLREARLIVGDDLADLARIAAVFRPYGVRIFTSIDYSSPISVGGLETADPLDPGVARYWTERANAIYAAIPDFGGFLVKADSENRPGPFTYGRDHAEGANVLAEALAPHGGLVIWRCFVYNCHQDWRDRSTDRARAAYDTFMPIDGRFADNVILQIKNGPVDFQVREPVSPLFGGLRRTNVLLEVQITQEYTGQQRHLCYLIPQWREVLGFRFHGVSDDGRGEASVASIVSGAARPMSHGGMVGVANVGDDENWTGHHLAQANLYGFGRLAWDPSLASARITEEWTRMTFGHDPEVGQTVGDMLLGSWLTYERYTAPLGVGWMCNPSHHYGPNPDGYEYSPWGTYHFADHKGVGVDRTVATGTGYSSQYDATNAEMYESLKSCPDELLLFFHHVPYRHTLRSGNTVIQHIYDTHFQGVEEVEAMRDGWMQLAGTVDERRYREVLARLDEQFEDASLWRDVINTYFLRKSWVSDTRDRPIHA
ncbi:MAG: alpha-glucuronidase family glycosyl hydrolase [Spirochaetales bacterium]